MWLLDTTVQPCESDWSLNTKPHDFCDSGAKKKPKTKKKIIALSLNLNNDTNIGRC